MKYNFLERIKFLFSSLNILSTINNINPKFIFFSESKSYQKFTKPIIEVLNSKYDEPIYYFSTQKDDFIVDKKVKNVYLNSLLLNFFFKNVKAENIFLTLTDLGNHFIKKTKNINKYIYYFHSPISTTKSYTIKAFDHYDIIMCNGQFQIEEIRTRERLEGLNEKKLIPTGYFYFDYLIENCKKDNFQEYILVAPSWNKNNKNLINESFIDLIDILLKKKFKVIFRPHPEHFKRSKKILDTIKYKFISEYFKFDDEPDNLKSMKKAKYLITDNSGIAIEFMVALKRPVLYLDGVDKIHNTDYKKYANLKTIDQTIKEKFGYLFSSSDFEKIELILRDSELEFNNKLVELNYLIHKNYFNFGKTKEFLYLNLHKIF